jgi:hypothetical protein
VYVCPAAGRRTNTTNYPEIIYKNLIFKVLQFSLNPASFYLRSKVNLFFRLTTPTCLPPSAAMTTRSTPDSGRPASTCHKQKPPDTKDLNNKVLNNKALNSKSLNKKVLNN